MSTVLHRGRADRSVERIHRSLERLRSENTTLRAEAATRDDALRAVIERSRDLVWWTRTQRVGRASNGPPIRGGSDVALVTSLITNAALCLHCIARKTSVPTENAHDLLRAVAKTLRLRIEPHRSCDACLQPKTTFSVHRSS